MPSTKEGLIEDREELKQQAHKREVRRARITALVLATSTIITLIFLVFAFIQKAQADQMLERLIQLQQQAVVDQQQIKMQDNQIQELEKQLADCKAQ